MNITDLVRTVEPYSMADEQRRLWMAETAKKIVETGIPGDFVECGVCNGGASAILAHYALPAGRKLHLFDSFEGLPPVTEKDTPSFGNNHPASEEVGKCVGSVKNVLEVIKKVLPYEDAHIELTGENWKIFDVKGLKFHVGWFKDTFPKAEVGQIAMLNLDSDWWASERLCWETWYPKVSIGGRVYVDDYFYWPGCRQAADEYFEALGIDPKFEKVGHSAWHQKL